MWLDKQFCRGQMFQLASLRLELMTRRDELEVDCSTQRIAKVCRRQLKRAKPFSAKAPAWLPARHTRTHKPGLTITNPNGLGMEPQQLQPALRRVADQPRSSEWQGKLELSSKLLASRVEGKGAPGKRTAPFRAPRGVGWWNRPGTGRALR